MLWLLKYLNKFVKSVQPRSPRSTREGKQHFVNFNSCGKQGFVPLGGNPRRCGHDTVNIGNFRLDFSNTDGPNAIEKRVWRQKIGGESDNGADVWPIITEN